MTLFCNSLVTTFKIKTTFQPLFRILLRAFHTIVLVLIPTFLIADQDQATASPQTATIMVFGDSVSAGYGMHPEQGWVHLLAEQLKAQALNYRVINASVNGETTGGGLVRLPKSLEIHRPDIIIIELGGNDGLRGYPISKIEANLNAMMRMADTTGAKILLIGMVLPPNYGRRYTDAFEALYARLAEDLNIQFMPFLLDGVATRSDLMQADGIHPRAEAQPMLLAGIWSHLQQLIPAAR